MKSADVKEQLEGIRKAYDLTVEQYMKGVDPLDSVPDEIANLPGYAEITNNTDLCSGAPDIKEYLHPEKGMRYLDAGCCANLVIHRLHRWPSVYYGVDISPALIEAMRKFADNHDIPIGALHVADVANLPFDNAFFDIASLIGVLEYCTIEYTESALDELCRVLKSNARMVLDIPNLQHPHVQTALKLEEYLGRPNIPKGRKAFEKLLSRFFITERVDDSLVMLKYFVRKNG
ncbi:hypothetical protein AMJ83_02080 [candidate division WOR_3 bacterium SM23_42]|uniref:Methyltransferase type 11 domain-containing protein n=1 Tax=candidate division WOR_3 bacterium SM23_42 TaxID=1703779 RepID=A0A0S8FV06_UNCW3|nr:MAG: hypothetical protein AMJ83_02080 [candidate division WOR_3 bacterium SM23_42]